LSQTKLNALVVIEDGKAPLPDGPDSTMRLGHDAQAQLRAGNTSAAIDQYAAALLLRPNDLDVQLVLGDALRAAGRWQEAKQFFTALLNDHPDDPWIRYNLALALRGLGDLQAARITIGPIVAGTPIVRITHANEAGKRAHITATQASALTPQGFRTTVTLQY